MLGFCSIQYKKIDHLGDKCGFIPNVCNANLSIERCVMCLVYPQVLFNPSI